MTESPGVAALLTALEDDEEHVAPGILRVRTELPGYEPVPDSDLVASVRRNTRLAVRTMANRQVPPAEEIWEAEKTTVERLRSGVPIEVIMAGFRVSIGTIEERMVELAQIHRVSDDEVLQLTRLLWQLSDAFSARAAAAYRAQGLTLALAEQRRRDEWLLALLGGSLDEEQIIRGVAGFRLDPEVEYLTCCTSIAPDEVLEEARQSLVRQLEAVGPVMLLPSEGRLVGILPTAPAPVAGVLIALGPPATRNRLAESAERSRTVVAAAELHSREGVHTAQSLGWRLAVPLSPDVSALLRERYLAPLESSGAFGGEVVHALQAYLEHDRSIPLAAEAMHVHVNTLRYRLQRFEQLTGRSLASTETLVELAWVLLLVEAS